MEAAHDILRALDCLGHGGLDIVSCPTCGRTGIDLCSLVAAFEKRAREEGFYRLPIKVALMGCVVNGPGEAREADIGIAGGKGEAVLFEHGQIVGKIQENEIMDALAARIKEKYM